MTRELWRAIPGYEGFYEVSSLGRVRSLGCKGRSGRGDRKPLMLKLWPDSYGYPLVTLSNIRKWRTTVHRLVLLAFVGPCPLGMQARHFPDPDRANNRLNNLSWATPLTNQRDRDTHGTHNKGIRSVGSKLDANIVRAIRQIKQWPYGRLISVARKYNVSNTTVAYIRNGKSWRHIT